MNEILCANCKRIPPEEGKKKCRPCLDKNNASARKYHDRQKANGICIRCGKNPSEDKWKCQECRKKDIRDCKDYCKKWREKHKENGLCSGCGKQPPLPGKYYCEICRDNLNNLNKGYRDDRKQRGLCIQCGEPTQNEYVRCDKCLAAQKELGQKRKDKLLSEGLCQSCGLEKFVEGQLNCETCCLKGISYSLWQTTSRWEELKTLYEKQGGVCPYTGEVIRIGVDASIDHIVPKSLGGSDELSNLQWINYWVNIMKWDRPEEEFKTMITKIYSALKARNAVND
jgi:hypothetical protein